MRASILTPVPTDPTSDVPSVLSSQAYDCDIIKLLFDKFTLHFTQSKQ